MHRCDLVFPGGAGHHSAVTTTPSIPGQKIAPGDLAMLLVIAVIWGVNNVAAKVAVNHMPPLFTAGLRFLLTVIVLAPWLRLPKSGWASLAVIAVLTGPLHFGVQYLGLGLAQDLSPMIIAMQLWIPASVAFAALLLGERIDGWRIAGIFTAFAGVVAMAFDPVVFAQLDAVALIAVAAAFYGAGAVLVRRAPSLHPLTFQAWIAAVCAVTLLGASGVVEQGQAAALRGAGWGVWAAIVFGALASSVIANALMFRLVQRYEVSRTTPYLFLSPVIGIVLGGVVLGDKLTAVIIIGGALTLAGVALVAIAERLPR
jgi:O-acetylserine/cysteine efflux transporter